jgi:predicted component of viral defense system (DUF524 family)
VPAGPIERAFVDCKTPEGRVLASVEIVPRDLAPGVSIVDHPLVLLPTDEARQFGEEPLQLRERSRYDYRLKPAEGVRVEIGLLPQRGIQPSSLEDKDEERGLIEPQDYCGLLPLTVIERGDQTQRPLATAAAEVRSSKVGYREDYRSMLTDIAEKSAGLLIDSHAPTKLRLATLWRIDSRILEQQLEFLRYTLESPAFRAAVDEVLRNPHRKIEDEREEREISRPFKADKDFARRLGSATRRLSVGELHPLRATLPSLPAHIPVSLRTELFDTPENRFAKMVLTEFRDFLVDVGNFLTRGAGKESKPEISRLLHEAERQLAKLEVDLTRGFFPDISLPAFLPLGSPVLQHRPGYRELLRFWLQFHAGAQMLWSGGEDVFHAGARNVATLYEYWLFFKLEELFREKFACDKPLHSLLLDKGRVPAQLVLKRGVELRTPVTGVWSRAAGRHMQAAFHFNHKFLPNKTHETSGSWTRGVQPDYTISVWPALFGEREAEEKELMVHVHFDAKYRVERVRELLGDDADDMAFATEVEDKSDPKSVAKYADLLKMHAYRDAIRRTAGAYVLYPGNPENGNRQYQGFHEVLPGLGAFAIRPGRNGRAVGMDAVSTFLDGVVEHLSNRTTARERVSYHVAESYEAGVVREGPVTPGPLFLPESDIYGRSYRALPPDEEMVLVAWYRNDDQLELARGETGFVFVRLGQRRGALHVHPNFAKVRRILLRTSGGVVASGLLHLREPGFQVYTRSELGAQLQRLAEGKNIAPWQANGRGATGDQIYALFKTTADPASQSQQWKGDQLMDLIERFESDARNKPVGNLGRTSPNPRILPLKEILRARL